MAALATLATTTLTRAVDRSDTLLSLASRASVRPGDGLYLGQELCSVVAYGDVGSGDVRVRRGQGGTGTTTHPTLQTVTIGRLDQFYTQDPVGPPPDQVLVSPWINTLTGAQWVPQGDETGGENATARWWAKSATTHGIGPLGVRTTVAATSAITEPV